MRTVAFSDPEVVKVLTEKFVCAWVNRRPDLKFKDGLYQNWKPRGLGNGAAVTNVTSVFAAADGAVLHAMPGYLDAAGFKRHLAFAEKMRDRLFDPAVKKDERRGLFVQLHLEAAKAAKDENEAEAHEMLAPVMMRVGDFKIGFFDSLGNVFR